MVFETGGRAEYMMRGLTVGASSIAVMQWIKAPGKKGSAFGFNVAGVFAGKSGVGTTSPKSDHAPLIAEALSTLIKLHESSSNTLTGKVEH